jgi:O-acetyl-ADP-ribose deacetylase
LGYPVYSDAFMAVHTLLYDLDVVVPFNWPDWNGMSLYPHGAGLEAASVADAARLCTVYVRGERFSDGAIGQALNDGTFDQIFKRLRTWYGSESGLAESGTRA